MKNISILIALLLLTKVHSQNLEIGDQVPDFQIELINANKPVFNYKKINNKAIIIDFWATWCAPCITAMPHLDALQKKYKEKLTVISVSEEDKSRLARFKAKKSFDFLFARDEGQLRTLFPYQVIPHSVIISPKGKLVAITSPENITEKVIEGVLREKEINLPIKKDKFDFDPSHEYFNFDENVSELFQLQPYMEGIPAFSRTYNKGIFKDRRIVIFNLNVAGLYRKAYDISDYRLVYEFDKNEIDWDDTKNRYCLNVISKSQEDLYTFMQSQLNKQTNIIATLAEKEIEVLVVKKITNKINAKKVFKKGSTEARGDGFSNKGATLKEFCNYLEYFGIVGMPVYDDTDDTNLYNISFSFDPENPKTFKKALEDLGLKYEKGKRKTRVLVLSKSND